ncbi:MAG: hypothetical protein ABL982_25565, partial [Vicinamibacterales bacterium]
WRHHELQMPPGPRSRKTAGLVCSMLPLDHRDRNFLDDSIAAAAAARLVETHGSGIITKDRLYRNLLSSQPTCFNLFGRFVSHPDALLGWVRTLDPDAVSIEQVRLEWAPERGTHFDGGSAFDAFVAYRTGRGGQRFVGVECKYAEDLRRSSIDVRKVYKDFTARSALWKDGASERLDTNRLKQFWLNTLLGQSLATRGEDFESGLTVVVAGAADRSAAAATDEVRAELVDPNRWLRWYPYEQVLTTIDGHDEWKSQFHRRYLDFGPVRHRLADGDPRLDG